MNNGPASDKNQQRKSGALKVSQLVGGNHHSSQMNGGDDFCLQDSNKLSLNRNPNLVAAL